MIFLDGLPAEFYFIAYSDEALTQNQVYMGPIRVSSIQDPPQDTVWRLNVSFLAPQISTTWWIVWLEFENGEPAPGAEKVLVGQFDAPAYDDPIVWGFSTGLSNHHFFVAPRDMTLGSDTSAYIELPTPIQLDNWDAALPAHQTKYQLDLSGLPSGDYQVGYYTEPNFGGGGPYDLGIGGHRLMVPSPNPFPDPTYYVEPPPRIIDAEAIPSWPISGFPAHWFELHLNNTSEEFVGANVQVWKGQLTNHDRALPPEETWWEFDLSGHLGHYWAGIVRYDESGNPTNGGTIEPFAEINIAPAYVPPTPMVVSGLPANFDIFVADQDGVGNLAYLGTNQLDNLDNALPPEQTRWEVSLAGVADGHWWLFINEYTADWSSYEVRLIAEIDVVDQTAPDLPPPSTEPPPPTPVGGYVRHRDRMVQESVFQDLRDTLIACRWMSGTTSRPVREPGSTSEEVLTVDPTETLALLEGHPIQLIDYFPESEEGAEVNSAESNQTPLNTFALDNGEPGESALLEMGSNAVLQPYVFNMAFYASSDALALAVMNDLRDRYAGRIVQFDVIDLYNVNVTPPELVVRMDVEKFSYVVNTEAIAPHEVHLYFAELVITDLIDAS